MHYVDEEGYYVLGDGSFYAVYGDFGYLFDPEGYDEFEGYFEKVDGVNQYQPCEKYLEEYYQAYEEKEYMPVIEAADDEI